MSSIIHPTEDDRIHSDKFMLILDTHKNQYLVAEVTSTLFPKTPNAHDKIITIFKCKINDHQKIEIINDKSQDKRYQAQSYEHGETAKQKITNLAKELNRMLQEDKPAASPKQAISEPIALELLEEICAA